MDLDLNQCKLTLQLIAQVKLALVEASLERIVNVGVKDKQMTETR